MTLEPATWAKLIAFGLFLLLAALAAAAQAALFYINRTRLRHLIEGGLPRAQAILKVFDEPTSIFATTLVLGTVAVAGVVTSVILLVLEPDFAASWGELWPLSALGVLVASIAVLLIVQIAARTVAVAKPEGTALRLVGPLRLFGMILSPVLLPLRGLERGGLKLLGLDRAAEPGAVAEEELRMLVETVEDSSALEEEEREMIHGIFGLGERPASEVMVPRLDIVAEPHQATIRQILDRVVASGFSRIPIYNESIDEVVGIVYAKDILRHLLAGTPDEPAEPLARPAYFVPETKKIDDLLHDLQRKRVHMAIVVDEYGGTAGLLTIEDLIEEIVGEIQDEHDPDEEQRLERVGEREALVDGRASIRDVNEALDLHLNVEDFDTIGGVVYHELGKVPVEGDEVRVNGALMTVLSTEGRRIKKVKITLMGETE